MRISKLAQAAFMELLIKAFEFKPRPIGFVFQRSSNPAGADGGAGRNPRTIGHRLNTEASINNSNYNL